MVAGAPLGASRFIRIPKEKARLGDRVIYRESSTGEVTFGGWIEQIDDNGVVTEVSSIWREGGNICHHALDTPKNAGMIEFYHRNIETLKDFEQIGGKIELRDARIIGLGESHVDDMHFKQIVQFIDSFANDGDVVLVEAVPATRGIRKEQWLNDTARQLKRIASFQEDLPSLSKKVKVFGWDDTSTSEWKENIKKEINIIDAMECAKDRKEYLDLNTQLKNIRKEIQANSIERNKKMKDTIKTMKSAYGSSVKIFVSAGMAHFTQDKELKEFLVSKKGIILKPLHKLSAQESYKRARKYYLEDSS